MWLSISCREAEGLGGSPDRAGGTAWGKAAGHGQAWNTRSSVSDASTVQPHAGGETLGQVISLCLICLFCEMDRIIVSTQMVVEKMKCYYIFNA